MNRLITFKNMFTKLGMFAAMALIALSFTTGCAHDRDDHHRDHDHDYDHDRGHGHDHDRGHGDHDDHDDHHDHH